MLTLMRSDDTLTLVSDDRNGENMHLQEAILASAPHLSRAFMDTATDDDGRLRFVVGKDDWEALADVIEELSCMSVGVNPAELASIEEALQSALNE